MFNVLDKTAPRDSSRPSGLVRPSILLPISLLILSSFTALAAPRAAQQPDGTERLVFDLTQTLETLPQLEQDPNQLRFQLEGLPTEQGHDALAWTVDWEQRVRAGEDAREVTAAQIATFAAQAVQAP